MRILLALTMIVLSACTSFITAPEVSLKDVKMVGLDAEGVDLDVHLLIRNTNSMDLKLNEYTYDLKIMSLPLAKGSSQTAYNFQGKAVTDLLIPVKIPYRSLIDVLKQRPDPNAVPYQLQADLSVGSPIGRIAIPVNKTGTFSIPKEYRPGSVVKKIGSFLSGFER